MTQTFSPTPITELFTDERGNRVFVKREDLLPYSFGGNKVRIGLCYLADMRLRGANHLIAYGNARSNLCRVLSNLCAAEGVPCTILSPADDDGARMDSFNLLLSRAFGAEIRPCDKTRVPEAVDEAIADSRRAGRKPYYIYGDRLGQGNDATPVAAYAAVYRELLSQETALDAPFDQIVLATGTGMTQAGLLCGQHRFGGAHRIVGISIARNQARAASAVAQYARAYLGDAYPASLTGDIHVDDAFALQYGQSTPAMRACIARAMTRYGLPLDATYTGKAFYGLCERLREQRGQRVLFLHTGGTPLFFDALRDVFPIVPLKEATQA